MLMLAFVMPASAQNDEEPMLTIKTHRYESYGAANQFQMSIMASLAAGTADLEIDLGDGLRRKYTVSSDGELTMGEEDDFASGGTYISGSVGPTGVVRLYGDPLKFDYLNVNGSEVYDIDLSKMKNLSILELSHNEISHLDLTEMTKLSYLDLKDNVFDKGLVLGSNYPNMNYLCLNQIGDNALASGTVDLSKMPALRIFTAWDAKCLRSLDVSHNPMLVQLSVDNSGIRSLDVTNNSWLMILNISECGFTKVDISRNPYLVEFYCAAEGVEDASRKLTSIDFSHNPYLQRIFVQGNRLRTLDISKQKNLVSLYASNNMLNEIVGLEQIDSLAYLDIAGNCFDFATLPYTDPMTYYFYDLQQPMTVAKEYAVGVPLDLSSRVMREGTLTECAVYTRGKDELSGTIDLKEGVDYTFENGVINFLKPQEDPVVCDFYNDFFEYVMLSTTAFNVSSAEDYGKPVIAGSMTMEEAGEVSFNYTLDHNSSLYVDWGDGELKEYPAQGGVSATATGTTTGTVKLYTTYDTSIMALDMLNQNVTAVDVTPLTELHKLSIVGGKLKDIDLSWNRRLQSLNLSHNQFTSIDLTGLNGVYNKNILTDVNLSYNQLTQFEPGLAKVTFVNLDLSNNQLEDFDGDELMFLKSLNLSNNKINNIYLGDCVSLQTLNVSDNDLWFIDFASCEHISSVDLRNNKFKYSALPMPADYIKMAPQKPVTIAERTVSVDLTSEATVMGQPTQYKWVDATDGHEYVAGTDYNIVGGKTTFLESMNGKGVYCVMTNAAFPEFDGANALRTINTVAVSMPQYQIASFTTPIGWQEAHMSLAATKPDTYIYMDWGDGELQEYHLQTVYNLFSATTIAGKTVKVYSNDSASGNVGVFSIGGITMGSIDVSKLADCFCLTLSGTGLNTIDLTALTKLEELNLEKNNLESVDLSKCTKLRTAILNGNLFSDFDLSNNTNLQLFAAAHNLIENINTNGLKNVFWLDLTGNMISKIDVSSMRGLQQLNLAENQLHEIDLSGNPQLMVLDIATNYFDFSTLPVPQYSVYYYGNQAPLDVKCVDDKVDLSSQADVDGIPSSFYWFVGPITLIQDEDGNIDLLNDELFEGEDFLCNNGVSTFHKAHDEVTGLIVNEIFPDILLYTKTISVTANPDGIENVKADNDAKAPAYNLQGQRVNPNTHRGIIIRNGQKKVVRK